MAVGFWFVAVAAGFSLWGASFYDSEYLIDSWETDQGLPENSATAMVQTPDGYLWFGSFNGLVRFDGVKFTVYDLSNTPELLSPGIVNLHLDASNRLWISTLRGLVVSEPKRWTTLHQEGRWTGDYVRTFSENAGVLALTSFNGKVFRVTAGRFEELPEPPGTRGQGYLGAVDGTGRVWVGQHPFPPEHTGVFAQWDGRQWQRSTLEPVLFPEFVSLKGLQDGSLLAMKSGELMRLRNEEIVSRVAFQWPSKIAGAWSLAEDRRGFVWVSGEGLYRVDPSGRVRYFSSTNGLTYDSLRFTFEDREGNHWVGTSGGGLMRFKPRVFRTYGKESGLTERNVKAVAEERPDRILIGTYGGGTFALEDDRVSLFAPARQPTSPFVEGLLLDRQRNLWIASFGTHLALGGLTLVTSQERRTMSVEEAGGRNVCALFEDSKGRVWVGGNQTVTSFRDGRFQSQTLPNGAGLGKARCFAEDPQGAIWAATVEGLFRLSGGQWREIKGPEGNSLRDELHVRAEPDGSLWSASAGAGLRRLKDGKWSAVTGEQGLPAPNISCILEDDFGYWWLGSNRGVIRARRTDLEGVADGQSARLPCQVFNLSDGLASVECPTGIQSTGLKDSRGRLWFATLKGVSMIDPRKFQANTNPPPMTIEAVSYLDRSGKPVRILEGQLALLADRSRGRAAGLTIPPGSSQLEAQFAALSFSAPEKVRLRFDLRRDGTQILAEEGTSRTLSLRWLPAGDYEVRAAAANNDGIWNEKGITLAFAVQPFYWQAWWFRTLLGLVLGGGVALSVNLRHKGRLRRAEERARQQQALAEERAKAGDALRRSEERYRAFIANSSEGIWRYEGDEPVSTSLPVDEQVALIFQRGYLAECNDALARMYGYQRAEELVGRRLSELAGDDPRNIEYMKNYIVEGYRLNGAVTVRKDRFGKVRYLENNFVGVVENGYLIRAWGVQRDITERHEVEEALRESEARFRSLVGASMEGIMVHDAGVILDANPAFAHLFGYSEPEELMGRNGIELLLTPESQARIRQRVQRSESGPILVTGVRKDGTMVDLETESLPMRYRGRDARIVSCRELTDRQRAEHALRESEAKFRTLFENAGDSLFLLSDGRFIDCNARAIKMLGCQGRDEVVGRAPAEFSPPQQPGGRDSRELALEKVTAAAGQPQFFEWTLRRLDGSVFPVEVNVHRIELQGKVLLQAIVRDITERKKTEERLQEQAALLQASHDAVLVWDMAEGIRYLNPAAEELVGRSLAAARGRPLEEVLRTRSDLALRAAIHEVLARGGWSGELGLRTEEGRTREVATRWTLLEGGQAGHKSVLISCNDITEQRLLEKQYLRAQRLESVGTLASGVAHDLNNILSPIIMGIELLDEAVKNQSEDASNVLAMMRESAHRGRDTVKQLLAFARGTESEKGPVQPRHLLKEIARLLQQTFPKNIHVYTDYSEPPPAVLADPSQLHQVLMNLCVNARDAMPEGGTLFLALENRTLDEASVNLHPKARPIPYVVFKVSDSGTGIPPEIVDRIFDPFFTTKPQGKGTGLGLSTVLGIVENHGGFVVVDSKQGHGTTFQAFIPASTAADTAAAATVEAAPLTQGRGELVLVVDDEPSILKMAERVLRRNGYATLGASGGSEGMLLYEANQERIRAVLTDVMMPFGDGRQLITKLHERDPALPIIAMSGVAISEFHRETARRGARAFLGKPFSGEQLLDALNAALSPKPPGHGSAKPG